MLAARGYDQSHALNRTRITETYQNMTLGRHRAKVADRAGLEAGTIGSAGDVHDFVQQNNETDWEFLWRLARRIDFEVAVADGRSASDRPAADDGSDRVAALGRRPADVPAARDRRPAGRRGGRALVGPDDQGRRSSRASRAGTPDASIGVDRGDVGTALGGGTMTMADRPVLSSDEADALATSIASRLANAYVEAEGTCRGNPDLTAGAKVRSTASASVYGGYYTLTSTSHVYRGRPAATRPASRSPAARRGAWST